MRIDILSLAGMMVLALSPAMAGDISGVEPHRTSLELEIVFTGEEIRIIRAHYEYHAGKNHNGNGKSKQKGLPPGIEKNLTRGKPLPRGIAKQYLPDDLLRSLPPVRDGHERIIVAGKILLIEIATQIVRDVLTDVLFD